MSRVTTTTWAPSAERDVGRIFTYFEQHSVVGARTMVRRIVRAVGLVAKQPEIGRVAEDIEPVGQFRSVVAAPWWWAASARWVLHSQVSGSKRTA